MPLPRPLPHLEPKSKLSSRPCPSLCPQPARALDRQTFPAYPAPALSLQFPKATQPTTGSPSDQVGVRGARHGLGYGCLQEPDRSFPTCRYGDGREGRCKWCWLTGYIFDTFNELIQTLHPRKDSPVLLPLCFGLCFLFQRHVPAKVVAPPYAGLGGRGSGTRHCALPLPSLGRMDLMRILWPLSVHGGILSFTHVVPIKKQIILKLKLQRFRSASQWAAGNRRPRESRGMFLKVRTPQ